MSSKLKAFLLIKEADHCRMLKSSIVENLSRKENLKVGS